MSSVVAVRRDNLNTIRRWSIGNGEDCHNLMDYVEGLWSFGGWRETKNRWYLATAGWSDNESIITALQQNLTFWTICWEESKRGGAHVFFKPFTPKQLREVRAKR